MYKSRQHVWVDGKELELITIGELARRLKRSVETIRAWERNGDIPKALFRGTNGLRLYHPDEVEVMRKVMKKMGQYAKSAELRTAMWREIITARKAFLNGETSEEA